MIAHPRPVRTLAALAGTVAALALTACSNESPEATDSDEPSTAAVESSTPAEEQSTPSDADSASEGVGDLEGTWSLDAEPPEAATLTVDASGYATYTTEGTAVDYWEGTAVPSADSVFTIEFTPSADSQDDTGGEDLDFTAEVTVEPGGDTLNWTSDGYDSTYSRSE